MKQKEIDDSKIAVLYRALEKGVPMEGDPVYL